MNQNTQTARAQRHLPKLLGAIFLALCACASIARADSGTWTNDASSVWSASTNWLNGVVASGVDATADFSSIIITTNRTVTLDVPETIGSAVFGNAGTLANTNWILNSSGGSVLTLGVSSGSPTVNVTNTAVVSAPIAGTAGLTKSGTGTLVLAGPNSYSGNTVVSTGTLKLTNTITGISATDPVLYMSFDNVSGAAVINQGSGGAAMNGTLFGGATIVPGGRYGNALSIPAGNSTVSYVLINNAVVPLNIQAGNNWTMGMWLKTSTAGGVYFYQGSGGWANANTEFYLENGTAGDGAGTHAGGVRFAQGWESGTADLTDGNWHFVVMTCTNAVKTIYVDGAVDAFTAGVNQWNGTGAGNQVRIGGSAAGADSAIGLSGLIDEVYVYNRALSPAEITTLMNASSGPTSLASPLPAGTPVSVAAGAKLDLNGHTPIIPGVTGTGLVDSTSGSPTLVVSNSSDVVFAGNITNTTGTVGLTKLGSAKLTLSGTNTYNGVTLVNNGTLNITGSLAPVNPGTASMIVGNGVVNFSGSFLTNFNYNIGTATNTLGALYHTAGTIKQTQGASGANFQLGNAPGAYGYYYLGAGATNFCNEIGIGGEVNPAGNAVVDVYGTLIDSGWVVAARGANLQVAGLPSTGILNVYPGSFMTYAGGGIVCNWGSGGAQVSVINMMGGTVTNSTQNVPINLNQSGNAANSGTLNLNGGVIQAGWVTGGANGTRVNFNGGTLQAAENQGVEMTGLAAATVYSGGGTINNNGFALTIAQQFIPPAGNGVSGIGSFTAGAGYMAPPIVTVVNDPSDTTGIGATAIAQIDPTAGTVTNVIITSRGVNYTATPTFVLTGGNPATPATITGAAPTANVSGGLNFTGSGSVTLNGGYTYTGPTTVSGGTLSLVPSTITPSVAGDLVVNNGTVNFPSTNGVTLPVGNLNLQTSATFNINYGTFSVNPTVAAITASGGITVAPTNLLNITAFGLKAGTFTLIKYGTGTISPTDFANIGFTLPHGVVGNLVNNTSSHSIDLNIVSSPNQLTWSGVGGVNWDLTTFNWTNNANGLAALYQQYTNTGVVGGDGVTFDDTLTNDFVNPQPTNVIITSGFTPLPVIVNSTLPYSFSGPGTITGVGNFVKNNTGSVTLLTSNSFSGGFAINGGSVIITNDSALGASSGVVTLNGGTLQVNGNTTNNARVLTVTATSTVGVSNSAVARFGGTVSGNGGLTKNDLGSLTLAGNNNITGALTVNQGTLTSLGTDNLPAVVTVGNVGSQDSVLIVGGGTLNAVNTAGQFNSGLVAGNAAGSSGDIQLSAGTLTVFEQFGLGGGNGAYAAFNMSGGTFLGGSYIVVGFNNDNAVFNQSGGTTTVRTNLMTIAAGGTGAIGVANFSGSSVYIATNGVTGNAGGRGGMYVGETGAGVLNVSGSASVTATGQTNITMGRTGTASSGTMNLLGGTVTTFQVSRGAGSGTLNFNGGVLKASGANPIFVTGLTGANVYNGGAIVDDGGFSITIPQSLLAAGGFGVASIPVVPGSSSGYIDTPIVTIQGGSGSNAMATATVSGGQITAVVVTSPGNGYLNSDSLSVSFTGGGINAIPPTLGTITFAANGTGGLTKRGIGTLALTGINTFAGPITNSAGTLSLNSASTYPGALVVNAGTVAATTASIFSGPATVTNGATLTITQTGSATNKMSDLTLNGGGAVPGAIVGLGLTGQNPTTALVNCGVLTANGTNTISLSGAMSVGPIPLIKYSSFVNPGGLTNLTLPQGVVGTLSNSVSDSILYAVITSTGPGLVWTGTNSGAGLTNLWDISSTTNWLLGSIPTTYRQPIIPGDAVTFNDSGSGTVILNTNAGPSSVTLSNNSRSYTISGRGIITGSGGITKLGTGTAILSLTNDNYTGDTTISNGTLQVGTTSALPGAANLNIGSSGTLELPGLSQTVNNLFGQGTVDNNTVTNVTLTLNNGGSWNGTIHDQGLGGGVSLTKIGNGTLVIGGSNYLTSPTASQVNAGLTIITNGATVTCVNSEYWVGAVGGLTATNIVDGGTVTTMNNFFVVGRGSANAVGTLIVNSGTVQKSGANVIVVGSLGATGTLIVNGGQVLNNSELWLGENATAVATLYLNGGLLQATDIRANGVFPTVQPIAYLNGGTLQASANSGNFIQVQSLVMSNGFTLDDGGFTVSLTLVPLVAGDSANGGLIKKGAGTLYMDVSSTYTGGTLVTNGTLAGIGGVAGNVVVAPNGNIGAGNASGVGNFNVGGSLRLQGKATMRVSKTSGTLANDQLNGYTSVQFGGTLVVTNATSDATPIVAGDTFQIFSTGGTGNFTSVIGSPGPGLGYTFNPSNGKLTVVAAAPAITGLGFTGHPAVSGTALTISGTNAGAGTMYLLTSTNIAAPLSTWQPVWTNVVGGDGTFTTNVPNAVNPAFDKQYYILSTTNN